MQKPDKAHVGEEGWQIFISFVICSSLTVLINWRDDDVPGYRVIVLPCGQAEETPTNEMFMLSEDWPRRP